ncbi:MAG: DUF1571 domain-containing protein [Planctomycetota bacterium]|jgi:hypothetical protein
MFVSVSFVFIFALVAGCSKSVTVSRPLPLSVQGTPYAPEGKRIQADAVAYLKKLYDRCEALEQYGLLFYRQERLGLLGRMGAMEEIRARFRRDPFSVKFDWDDPKSDYFESVYVAGENNNKLLVRQRGGFFGLLPKVLVINVSDPVIWGKSKNPITNFGLAQVTHRTLEPFEDPEVAAVMSIKYEGLVDLGPQHRPAHYLLIERSRMEGKRYIYTRQDYYIDAATLWPAGTDLWLPNGKLDARYRYAGVDTNVSFTDTEFRLTKGHPKIGSKK